MRHNFTEKARPAGFSKYGRNKLKFVLSGAMKQKNHVRV
jgi:hypothetical protein